MGWNPEIDPGGTPRTSSAGASAGRFAWWGAALLLVTVAIAAAPLAIHGPSCGQDFDFHFENWLEVNRSWHQGVFYPHWATSANYGAGEPRFVFYPPMSWMLGGALGSLLPWSWTPLAFALLVLLGAGLSFRAMAREWMSADAAGIGACIYVTNPYMLFTLYERGALAEVLAATWIPLLVLFGLRKKPALIPLALVVAAIWLTNAPAAVMGCYMLAALVVLAALREHSWRLVLRGLSGLALGLGLAAFWIIPAWYQQRWVQIGRAIGPLMRVEDSFLFETARLWRQPATAAMDANLAYHNAVLYTASWIVTALMAAALLAALLSRRRRNFLWMPLVAVGACIGALQFRWSDLVWRIMPELKFLQFPWRWMMVLGMIVAALAALALSSGGPRREAALSGEQEKARFRRFAFRAVAVLLLAVGLAWLASRDFWQFCDDEDNVGAQIATFHQTGFEGTDEYTPAGARTAGLDDLLAPDPDSGTPPLLSSAHPILIEAAPDIASSEQPIPAQISIERWHVEDMSAVVTTPRPGYAVLRLMDYPAWRVTRNGRKDEARTRWPNGLMVIPVDAGANHIAVRWVTTSDVWAGRGISLAALAVTLALILLERRKARRVPRR